MVETLLSLRGLSIELVRGSDRRQILDGIDIDVARDRAWAFWVKAVRA